MVYYIVIVGYYKTCLQHSGPCHTPERPESFEVMSAYEMHPVFGYTCNSKLHTKKYICLDLDIQKRWSGRGRMGGTFSLHSVWTNASRSASTAGCIPGVTFPAGERTSLQPQRTCSSLSQ